MRFLRDTPTRTVVKIIAVVVIAILVAVAAVAGLVNSYRYDQDAQRRERTQTAQLLAGCVRSNQFRAEVAAVARSAKATDKALVDLFTIELKTAPADTPQSDIKLVVQQRTKFRKLGERIQIPAQQDCKALYDS